jgi:hypothetical protein
MRYFRFRMLSASLSRHAPRITAFALQARHGAATGNPAGYSVLNPPVQLLPPHVMNQLLGLGGGGGGAGAGGGADRPASVQGPAAARPHFLGESGELGKARERGRARGRAAHLAAHL